MEIERPQKVVTGCEMENYAEMRLFFGPEVTLPGDNNHLRTYQYILPD